MSSGLFEEKRLVASEPLDPQERAEIASIFNQYHAETVKQLARQWFGRDARTRKQECVNQLADAFANPTKLQAVYDSLTPFEKAGLWLLVERGGTLPVLEFAPTLLASGYDFREQVGYHNQYRYGYDFGGANSLLKPLLSLDSTGLLIPATVDGWSNSLSHTPFVRHTAVHGVSTFRRLLPHIQPVPLRPLELTPCAVPLSGDYRRPAQAVMPIVSIVEALRSAGELTLTARGSFPRPFANKIAKRWGPAASAENPALPDPIVFYLQLFISARFLEIPDYDRATILDPVAEEIMAAPYGVQAGHWLNAYRSVKGWHERLAPHTSMFGDQLHTTNTLHSVRNLVVTALGALPDPEAWYTTAAFSEALFTRSRALVTLGHARPWFPPYNLSKAKQAEKYAEYLEKRSGAWRSTELPFIAGMLEGPLFALGLVEIAATSEEGQAFRLTDLGRAAIYRIPLPESVESRTTAPDTWIVQPNLEIIAYLDRARPQDLAFLAKVAERKSSTGPAAVYTVTREAIYSALESGFTVDELIQGLQLGSARDLPDTLVRSVREWAARRERISVYPHAALLQYANAAARDAALPTLPSTSRPIGDQYVLVTESHLQGPAAGKEVPWIDYAGEPYRCVAVDEDGTLRIDPQRSDLLVASELDAFADHVTEAAGTWTLSRESVQRAVNAGHTPDGILKALRLRTTSAIPAILAVGVVRWGRRLGQPAPATLETVLVLELPTEEIAGAVASSARFKPLLRSRLGPRAFSVALADQAALNELLAEYGLTASAITAKSELQTTSKPTPKPAAASRRTRTRTQKPEAEE